MEVAVEDAPPLFQTGRCPFCRQSLFGRTNLENEPFMLLWRAIVRFKELESKYKVEFLLYEIDE
jgi:hypothetical protein